MSDMLTTAQLEQLTALRNESSEARAVLGIVIERLDRMLYNLPLPADWLIRQSRSKSISQDGELWLVVFHDRIVGYVMDRSTSRGSSFTVLGVNYMSLRRAAWAVIEGSGWFRGRIRFSGYEYSLDEIVPNLDDLAMGIEDRQPTDALEIPVGP